MIKRNLSCQKISWKEPWNWSRFFKLIFLTWLWSFKERKLKRINWYFLVSSLSFNSNFWILLLIQLESSPVFYEMLKSESMEDEDGLKNTLELDLEPDIVKEIINFIYKDEIQHLKMKSKILLIAAKKVSLMNFSIVNLFLILIFFI